MDRKREELTKDLLDICFLLESNSKGRIQISLKKNEGIQFPDEMVHFIKFDGNRIGLDIESLVYMTYLVGFSMPLLNFAQCISLIKAQGCSDAYMSVRELCSDLEKYIEDKYVEKWRDIFSITVEPEEKKDEWRLPDENTEKPS